VKKIIIAIKNKQNVKAKVNN